MIIPKDSIDIRADVRKVLEAGSDSETVLCKHQNINKWSKRKPIHYKKDTGLLDSEFEGWPGDKIQGIYYGLKCTTEAGNISSIHSVTFEYVGRPRGGEDSPCRIGDFRGYDSNAKCNLTGVFDKKEVDIDKDTIPISIYFDEYNTTGVDINKLVPQNTALNDVGHCYPAIVIDHYIHALINAETQSYTQLKNNYAWQRYFRFEVNQSKAEMRLPFYSTGSRQVSFCLVENLFHKDGTYDFREWVDVTNLVDNTNSIAIPEATGLVVNFVQHLPPIIPLSAIAMVSEFNITFTNNMEPRKEYNIPVRIRDIDTGAEYTDYVVQHRYEFPSETVTIFGQWNQLNILPTKGHKVNLSVTVDYNNRISSKTFNLTII